ncbi:MAG: Fe(3+) ABC transporter substrate-binding protein [Alphaproteobacteria bacterium]
MADNRPFMALAVALALGGAATGAAAQDNVVNVYSARHYDTDMALYDEFTAETGITVNLIEADADELIERIAREGANSPADVFITVDAGRLWRATEAGVLAPIRSEILEAAVPASLRHPEGYWFGISKRARLIFYNHETVDDPSRIQTYEALADPELGYTICVRSSGNIYNQSLLAALIAEMGEEQAEAWAAGVVANMGRDPEGGDRDQLAGAANGECDIAVSNHYYFTRMVADDDPDIQAIVAALTPIFPNQTGRGTHVNISGAGVVATAPHRDAAVAFLEYLLSPRAQEYFAAGNYELPVSPEASLAPEVEQVLAMAGVGPDFKQDPLNLAVLGENNPLAVMIFDRVSWK